MVNGRPLISVVMSVYNESEYIVQSVQSILRQTFFDIELIIVNDGSTDDTLNKILEFGDPRIRIINQPRRGLASALNEGIKISYGKYIARQDGDDFSESTRLEKQIKFFSSHPEFGMVGTNSILIDKDGKELDKTKFPISNEEIQRVLLSEEVNAFIHGSVMYYRDLAEAVGGYRSEFKQGQDYDLWLRMAERTKIANIPDYLYYWRLTPKGVGVSKWEDQRDYGRLARICAELRRNGQSEPVLENLHQVERPIFRKLFTFVRSVDQATYYQFTKAQIMFSKGDMVSSRRELLRVTRKKPFHLYALLLLILSILPSEKSLNIWRILQSKYRKVIWR